MIKKSLLEITLEGKETIKENDIVVFSGDKKWKVVNKEVYLEPYLTKIANLEKEIEEYKNTIDTTIKTFKDDVNSKLEDYHKILQVLTKEED